MDKIFGQLISAPLNETGPVRPWYRSPIFFTLDAYAYIFSCMLNAYQNLFNSHGTNLYSEEKKKDIVNDLFSLLVHTQKEFNLTLIYRFLCSRD